MFLLIFLRKVFLLKLMMTVVCLFYFILFYFYSIPGCSYISIKLEVVGNNEINTRENTKTKLSASVFVFFSFSLSCPFLYYPLHFQPLQSPSSGVTRHRKLEVGEFSSLFHTKTRFV